MNTNKLRVAISIAAIFIAGMHIIFPDLKIDTTTLVLLIVALIPWLAPILKSVELPGGFKIELQDVERAAGAALQSQSSSDPHFSRRLRFSLGSNSAKKNKEAAKNQGAISRLKDVAGSDPNLALVGFRIEIERRLRELAKRNGIDDRRDLSFVLNHLQLKDALPSDLLSALGDLIALGNKAAHGESVDPAVTPWIFDKGIAVLNVLDKFIAAQKNND